jgi:hypothetical protein
MSFVKFKGPAVDPLGNPRFYRPEERFGASLDDFMPTVCELYKNSTLVTMTPFFEWVKKNDGIELWI